MFCVNHTSIKNRNEEVCALENVATWVRVHRSAPLAASCGCVPTSPCPNPVSRGLLALGLFVPRVAGLPQDVAFPFEPETQLVCVRGADRGVRGGASLNRQVGLRAVDPLTTLDRPPRAEPQPSIGTCHLVLTAACCGFQ